MYKPKHFELRGTNNATGDTIKFKLELYGTVTIVKGNSGIGKSLMCEIARQMKKSRPKKDLKIEIFDLTNKKDFSIEILSKYKNRLIIVDDANFLVYGDILKYILMDDDNYYILFRRDNYDVKLSPNYYASLSDDKKNGIFELKYECSNKRWY